MDDAFQELLNETLEDLFEGQPGMATRVKFGATKGPNMGASKSIHRGAVERVEMSSDKELDDDEEDEEETKE